MSRRDRYRRAKLAGATALNPDDWQTIVGKAASVAEGMRPRFDPLGEPQLSDRPNHEPVWLMRGQMVVEARQILNVEAALAEAEELHLELLQIASEDLNAARRDRLLRTLEAAKAKIRKRLSVEQS